MRVMTAGTAAAVIATACISLAADWPQWQGPDRNSVSRERGLLQEWTPDGPPLAWKVDGLGGGDSAPSVAGGRIFGMANRGADEVVWALSESDGSPLWVTRLGPAFEQSGFPQGKEGPAATPTVDGELLYVMGLAGNVACLKVRDGAVVWQRSLRGDFGAPLPTWSFRESPLVDGERVIVTPGAAGATLVALDKRTGKTIWKSAVPGDPKAAYSSAIAIDLDGQRQYVQFTEKGVVGVAVSDGAFLWRYDAPANSHGINISTLLHHDGQVQWDQRAGGRKAPKGSVALADGRLYYRTEEGTMLLIEPNAREYVERGRFEPPGRSGKPAWAHPVIANGRL